MTYSISDYAPVELTLYFTEPAKLPPSWHLNNLLLHDKIYCDYTKTVIIDYWICMKGFIENSGITWDAL